MVSPRALKTAQIYQNRILLSTSGLRTVGYTHDLHDCELRLPFLNCANLLVLKQCKNVVIEPTSF